MALRTVASPCRGAGHVGRVVTPSPTARQAKLAPSQFLRPSACPTHQSVPRRCSALTSPRRPSPQLGGRAPPAWPWVIRLYAPNVSVHDSSSRALVCSPVVEMRGLLAGLVRAAEGRVGHAQSFGSVGAWGLQRAGSLAASPPPYSPSPWPPGLAPGPAGDPPRGRLADPCGAPPCVTLLLLPPARSLARSSPHAQLPCPPHHPAGPLRPCSMPGVVNMESGATVLPSSPRQVRRTTRSPTAAARTARPPRPGAVGPTVLLSLGDPASAWRSPL